MKVFLEDVGILTYLYFNIDMKQALLNGETKSNFGSIYENAVAVLLKSHGYDEIYYYNSKKNGEVDFIIESKTEIIPIEIKSGKDYATHNALNNLLNIKEYDIKNAYVFAETNVKKLKKITYFPIYMIEFLEK